MTPMTNSSDRLGDEPSLSGEEWVEYGGELIWAVDFTAGGAPVGLTSKEFRRLNAELEHRADWARAKALLAWAFEACSSAVAGIEVGRVKKVGEGLFRRVYAAHVDLSPDPENLSGVWAVLLPDRRATTADCRRWVREVTILGQLAAAIHAVDVTAWRSCPPGAATRRAHAEELMRVFDDLEGTETGPAQEWAVQHLPQDRAAVLVHGDLLGQNILMFPDEPPAVIDWEFCRMGDPAFDLAIVTRGVRRPFQMARGLDRLLDAYAAAGGDPITRSEVHFYELCLAARWYREALQGRGSEPPEQALAKLKGILRRAEESTR